MTQRKPLLLLALMLATSATGVALAAGQTEQKPAPQRLDANGDGVVDRQEAAANPRLAQRFDELDKNKDGKLSRDEMPSRHFGDRHGRRGHGGREGGLLRQMDTNHDGRVSAAEYRAYFDHLDVNKDGYIDQADREARAEQRRTEWFNQADTNKDGKLSQAELEAARAKNGHRGPRGPVPSQTPAAK